MVNGEQLLVDVTIRTPTTPTYYECKDGSADEQLKSTVIAEQQKTNKYSAMAKAQDAKFLPFACEVYGGIGKSANKLLKQIYKSARDQMLMWPYQQIVEHLRGTVAISIQKGNAVAILAGYARAVRRSADGYRGLTALSA